MFPTTCLFWPGNYLSCQCQHMQLLGKGHQYVHPINTLYPKNCWINETASVYLRLRTTRVSKHLTTQTLIWTYGYISKLYKSKNSLTPKNHEIFPPIKGDPQIGTLLFLGRHSSSIVWKTKSLKRWRLSSEGHWKHPLLSRAKRNRWMEEIPKITTWHVYFQPWKSWEK